MQVQCTQCGASVALQEGSLFLDCPYCSSALYVDKSRTVFHFVISPTIAEEDAQGKLRRWMAGNETVKDLDRHAVLAGQELIYFPMWRFVAQLGGEDREYREMAAAFAIPEIKSIPLSGGDLKFFSPGEFQNKPLRQPDVLLDSAIQWLKDQHSVEKERIKESNLIHIPFYLFKYTYKNNSYQAVVDAISGRVLASIYPAKSEIPFTGITILASVVFLVAGFLSPNILIRFAVYLALGVPFAGAAYAVVKKY